MDVFGGGARLPGAAVVHYLAQQAPKSVARWSVRRGRRSPFAVIIQTSGLSGRAWMREAWRPPGEREGLTPVWMSCVGTNTCR